MSHHTTKADKLEQGVRWPSVNSPVDQRNAAKFRRFVRQHRRHDFLDLSKPLGFERDEAASAHKAFTEAESGACSMLSRERSHGHIALYGAVGAACGYALWRAALK